MLHELVYILYTCEMDDGIKAAVAPLNEQTVMIEIKLSRYTAANPGHRSHGSLLILFSPNWHLHESGD